MTAAHLPPSDAPPPSLPRNPRPSKNKYTYIVVFLRFDPIFIFGDSGEASFTALSNTLIKTFSFHFYDTFFFRNLGTAILLLLLYDTSSIHQHVIVFHLDSSSASWCVVLDVSSRRPCRSQQLLIIVAVWAMEPAGT